jgi:hypothetical protein
MLGLGFAISCTGDVLWVVWGVKNKVWALVWLDAVLLMADIMGVVRVVG